MVTDDELCLCFHVSWRKVINYIRIHRIRIPSQVAECQGAGTGCGWCRVFIRKLVEHCGEDPPKPDELEQWIIKHFPNLEKYSEGRRDYISQGKGTPPPGASP